LNEDGTYYFNGFIYEEIKENDITIGMKVKANKDIEMDYSKVKFEKEIHGINVISMERCYEGMNSLYFPDYGNEYKITNANYAFANCYNLRKIPKLPNSIETMDYCFQNCDTLLSHSFSLNFPSSLKSAEGCFNGCHFTRRLNSSSFPSSLVNARKAFEVIRIPFAFNLTLNNSLKYFDCSLLLNDNYSTLDISLQENIVKMRLNVQKIYFINKKEVNPIINFSIKDLKTINNNCKDNNIYGNIIFENSENAVDFIKYIFVFCSKEEREMDDLKEYMKMLKVKETEKEFEKIIEGIC
jgi:hypothetical protein